MTTSRINYPGSSRSTGRAIDQKAAASEKKPGMSIFVSLEFVISIWLCVVRECLQQPRTGSNRSINVKYNGITGSI